jgi:hypothetical protein
VGLPDLDVQVARHLRRERRVGVPRKELEELHGWASRDGVRDGGRLDAMRGDFGSRWNRWVSPLASPVVGSSVGPRPSAGVRRPGPGRRGILSPAGRAYQRSAPAGAAPDPLGLGSGPPPRPGGRRPTAERRRDLPAEQQLRGGNP